jgi:hypothetical protein
MTFQIPSRLFSLLLRNNSPFTLPGKRILVADDTNTLPPVVWLQPCSMLVQWQPDAIRNYLWSLVTVCAAVCARRTGKSGWRIRLRRSGATPVAATVDGDDTVLRSLPGTQLQE